MNMQQIFLDIASELNRCNTKPVYLQIVEAIQQRIDRGEIPPGQLLPPLRTMAQLLSIGQTTVRHAINDLAFQNVVVKRQGSGIRITDRYQPRNQSYRIMYPIYIVFDDTGDGYPFITPMLQYLRQEIRKQDSHISETVLQSVSLPIKEDDESRIASLIDLPKASGVLFNSPLNMTLLNMCIRQGVPYVLLYNELADGSSPCVMVEYGIGMSHALESLHQTNRQRIVLLTPDQHRFSTGKLTDIFQALLYSYGFECGHQAVVTTGYHQQQGYNQTIALLKANNKPDAIIYSSDYQALGGLYAARDAGIRVPEQLAVIGMGNMIDQSEWPQRLSTLDLHMNTFCQKTLNALFHHHSSDNLRYAIPCSFIKGQTS